MSTPITLSGPYARTAQRLLPLLFLGYVAAFLNRVNVGFAKLQMSADLGFSDAVYGFGAGIFFIGYFLLETPSNVCLHKFGARVWLARIMATWAVVSAVTVFVRTPWQFYSARLVLGMAEAGFFPGIILYLSYWFPSAIRARVSSLFICAIAFAGVVGGPLSGAILQDLSGACGVAGWKWLLAIESIPALLLAVLFYAYLPNRIDEATWLSESDKATMKGALAEESRVQPALPLSRLLGSPGLWALSASYFGLMMGLYGISFWMPQIIKDAGVESAQSIGLVSAIPYAVATVAMLLVSRHSDRKAERPRHAAASFITCAGGFGLIGLSGTHFVPALLGLVVATAGVLSAMPVFWSHVSSLLGGMAAVTGIAIINSVGNLGGFLCPYLLGRLVDATHSQQSGCFLLAGILVAASVIVFGVRKIGLQQS